MFQGKPNQDLRMVGRLGAATCTTDLLRKSGFYFGSPGGTWGHLGDPLRHLPGGFSWGSSPLGSPRGISQEDPQGFARRTSPGDPLGDPPWDHLGDPLRGSPRGIPRGICQGDFLEPYPSGPISSISPPHVARKRRVDNENNRIMVAPSK